MSLDVNDVRFWHCPVSAHTAIVWEGAIARCEECSMSSVETEEITARARAEQRQLDVRWLRSLAQKARAARNSDSQLMAGDLPLVPASVLERVAALLEECPIGEAES